MKRIYTGKGNLSGITAPIKGTECEISLWTAHKCSCGCGQSLFLIEFPLGFKKSDRTIGYSLFSEDCFEEQKAEVMTNSVTRELVKELTENDKLRQIEKEPIFTTNAKF